VGYLVDCNRLTRLLHFSLLLVVFIGLMYQWLLPDCLHNLLVNQLFADIQYCPAIARFSWDLIWCLKFFFNVVIAFSKFVISTLCFAIDLNVLITHRCCYIIENDKQMQWNDSRSIMKLCVFMMRFQGTVSQFMQLYWCIMQNENLMQWRDSHQSVSWIASSDLVASLGSLNSMCSDQEQVSDWLQVHCCY